MTNRICFHHDEECRSLSVIPSQHSIIRAVNLVYYEPGVDMPMHDHGVGQFSTMLSGLSQECNMSGDIDLPLGIVAYKPINYRHSNKIGPEGAIFLSIDIRADHPDFLYEYGRLDWATSDVKAAKALWRCLLVSVLSEQAASIDFEEQVLSLLNQFLAKPRQLKTLPHWLKLAQQAVVETSWSISDVASEVGVHRVHLCRAFQSQFGLSVSQFRQRHKLQTSLFSMFSQKQDIASASLQSGFADQSHFTRTLKQHFGITPMKLLRVFSPN